MVADKVRVSVFGKIRNNLYSAFVSKDNEQSRSAYVISQNKVENDFEGIVIAVAEFDGLFGKRLIVSPPGEIYYEHDLRRQLSKLKNIKLKSITCLYEKSCGAVVFYKSKQNIKILLVKNSNGKYWSFPKGHVEQEDKDEQTTAIREIKEETGLDVALVKDFREISEYCPFGKIKKRVVFFLAQAFTDKVEIQEDEIESYIWVDLQQARKMCGFDNDLRIIEKVETAIHFMHT